MPPVLVFVQSIERAKELFHELIYEGINVDVIHADRTQQQVGVVHGGGAGAEDVSVRGFCCSSGKILNISENLGLLLNIARKNG